MPLIEYEPAGARASSPVSAPHGEWDFLKPDGHDIGSCGCPPTLLAPLQK